jgi:DNA-binding SARP family transcriptional activator
VALTVEFRLLGPVTAWRDGQVVPLRRAKERTLLAALLLNAGRTVSATTLMEVLWGAELPASAPAGLQVHMMRLRRSLGDEVRSRVSTRHNGYEIAAAATELDVARAEELLRSGRAAVRDQRWLRAAELSAKALAEWRGEPLADVSSELLALQEVPRLSEIRLQLWEMRAEAGLMLGRHAELISELQRLASAYPLREHLRALLMRALCSCGRQADAVACYRHIRHVLISELGTEPGTELASLHRRILAGDAFQAEGQAVTVSGPVPARQAGDGTAALVPRQLPCAARWFAGRQAEFAALTALLDQLGSETSGTTAVLAISGTVGVGKTALAMHWAHRVAGQFPDGQLYANLHGFDPSLPPVAARTVVRDFLGALGVPPARIPVGAEAQSALYRTVLASKRVLIVLDNARGAEQVRTLLPGGSGCFVVVTSRASLVSLAASEGAHLLTLDLLSVREARELLSSRLGAEPVLAEPEAADELIRLCARLPLALGIVAARAAASRAAASRGARLAALAAELSDTAGRLDVLDAEIPACGVRAAFSWSYQSLPAAAARMFRLLGLHPGPDISAAAAASLAGLPRSEARSALHELARTGLIAERVPDRFALHDLLRIYARERAAAGGDAGGTEPSSAAC